MDESEATDDIWECSVYSDEVQANYAEAHECWRGRYVYFYNWPVKIVCKEWKCPDAKLIVSITYKESTCSMRELLEMDADKVMAYFKQNNLTFPQNMV
jgi:hypothetical protein